MAAIPTAARAEGGIAYIAYADGYWQAWVMDADGGNAHRVSRSAYDKGKLSWYPDGIRLLVNGTQGQIAKLDTRSGDETELSLPFDGIADAVVGPSGDQIAFSLSAADSVDRNDLWLVGTNGEGLRKLTHMRGLQHEPAWVPDGKALYFLSGITGAAKRDHDIWRIDLASGSVEQITSGALFHLDVAVARDGDLAYSNNQTGDYEIWIHSPDGRTRKLTESEGLDAHPTWSPDGREIVFESARGGAPNLWKVTLGGGVDEEPRAALVQLTHHPVGARSPTWFAGR